MIITDFDTNLLTGVVERHDGVSVKGFSGEADGNDAKRSGLMEGHLDRAQKSNKYPHCPYRLVKFHPAPPFSCPATDNTSLSIISTRNGVGPHRIPSSGELPRPVFTVGRLIVIDRSLQAWPIDPLVPAFSGLGATFIGWNGLFPTCCGETCLTRLCNSEGGFAASLWC